MHKMDDTPRIITIIGLVLEGMGALGMIASRLFLTAFMESSMFTAERLELTQEEFSEMMYFMGIMTDIVFAIAIIMIIFFIINLVLFTGLIRGKYTNEKARSIYLYQAIWGGLSIFFNTITGILYLISGVQGRSGHKEVIDIREGI